MSAIDEMYIRGVSQALHNVGICKIANMDAVVMMATNALMNTHVKTAMPGMGQDPMAGMGQDPMAGMGQDPMAGGGQPGGGQPGGEQPAPSPTPDELAQVAQSGLTEGDIQSAAKVVQVLAEMKQKADLATQAQVQATPGAAGAAGAAAMPGGAGMIPGTATPAQPPLPPPPQGAAGGLAGGGGMPGISGVA